MALWLSMNRMFFSKQISCLSTRFCLALQYFFPFDLSSFPRRFWVLASAHCCCFCIITFIYTNFRFQDLSSASFTLFNVMVGADSLFDTAIGTFQINYIMSVQFYMKRANFSIITIKKLILATVEEGYFDQKQLNKSNWLRN